MEVRNMSIVEMITVLPDAFPLKEVLGCVGWNVNKGDMLSSQSATQCGEIRRAMIELMRSRSKIDLHNIWAKKVLALLSNVGMDEEVRLRFQALARRYPLSKSTSLATTPLKVLRSRNGNTMLQPTITPLNSRNSVQSTAKPINLSIKQPTATPLNVSISRNSKQSSAKPIKSSSKSNIKQPDADISNSRNNKQSIEKHRTSSSNSIIKQPAVTPLKSTTSRLGQIENNMLGNANEKPKSRLVTSPQVISSSRNRKINEPKKEINSPVYNTPLGRTHSSQTDSIESITHSISTLNLTGNKTRKNNPYITPILKEAKVVLHLKLPMK
jgi:hypothetical protein